MELSHTRNNGKIQDYKLGHAVTREYQWKGSPPTSSLSSTSIPPSLSSSICLCIVWRASRLNLSSSVKHGGLSDMHGSEIKQRAITNLPPQTQAIVKTVEFQTKPTN